MSLAKQKNLYELSLISEKQLNLRILFKLSIIFKIIKFIINNLNKIKIIKKFDFKIKFIQLQIF